MRQVPRWIVFAFLILTVGTSAGFGSTIAPPYNLGEIVRVSQAAALAEVVSSTTELRGKTPYTLTTFRALQQVAGERLGATFTVETPGGVVGKLGYVVPGTPVFSPKDRYLLFLDRAPNGNWRLKMSSYGILREVARTGLLQPVPEAAQLDVLTRPGVEAIGVYRKADLLQHLAAVHGGAPWHAEAAAAGPADLERLAAVEKGAGEEKAMAGGALQNVPPNCQFIMSTNDGNPIRWFGFETGGSVGIFSTTPGQVGITDGGVSAVQNGAAAWTNHNASAINLQAFGPTPSSHDCSDGIADVLGQVTFNDPCNQMPALGTCVSTPPGFTSNVCCGEVAQYGFTYNPTTTPYDGSPWHPLTGFSVVVNDGSQCLGETNFAEMTTHFLGHGLGFNHHTDNDATMNVSLGVHPPRGAAIGAPDKVCASYAYHTFLDVPFNFFAWKFIEAVKNAGAMTDCGSGNFCPTDFVTRGSMAQFLLKAKEGASFVPPPCTTPTFSDVPCSDPRAPWIEELVRRGVTAGCGGSNYCPETVVNRNQIAVFLIKTLEGPSFVPAACTTPPFNDIPCSSPFAPWVREITDRGITAGCGGGNYCPTLELNKAQIAVFLTVTFGLPQP
jgi:hypothetical protein